MIFSSMTAIAALVRQVKAVYEAAPEMGDRTLSVPETRCGAYGSAACG
jgi:hypothetical protein